MSLQGLCEKLGKNNNAVYAVVAVACFKGIFRPMFTMSDKKQEPKSKKYAAIREGATEIIAIPTYIGLAKLTEKLAPKLALDKSIKGNFTSPNKALHFIGVCAAALVVIPGLCSLAMPHILKIFNKDKSTEANPQPIAINPTITPVANPVATSTEKPKPYITNAYGKVSINTGGGVRI